MIEFKLVNKIYHMGDETIKAVDNISFTIPDETFTVILGPSGSGKSTTLNLLGGMDTATSGKILLDGEEITGLNEKQLEEYRRRKIGFVFQFYNLIPQLTAKENVAITAKMIDNALDVDEVIEGVGLKKRRNLFPSNLSGGELQRVAIARALVKRPRILLCDEPTGALDSGTGREVMNFIKKLNDEGTTIVLITHDNSIAAEAKRRVQIRDGKIIADEILKVV